MAIVNLGVGRGHGDGGGGVLHRGHTLSTARTYNDSLCRLAKRL